jgi:type IV pilus assembly protein PilQ
VPASSAAREAVETGSEPEVAEPPFQIAAAEPIWEEAEEAAEVAVEPMPLPLPVAPAPAPVAAAQTSDSPNFGVGNVQIEQPAAPTPPERAYEPQALGTERRYFGEPMDLSLQDADVKDVLRSFAQLSGVNLVLQPGIRGRVTVELVQVPWDQALEQILKITDLGYDLDGNIMRIAPIQKLRQEAEEQQRLVRAQALSVPLSTVIRRVSYAKASDVARVLSARGGVMSQRGSVIVDRRTNTLIIKELPAFMNTVIAIIENLDIPEPQVMIEARIIETTKRFSRSLGIEWGFSGVASAATGNATGLEFPNNGTVDGGVNLLTGGQNGFINMSLGNVLSTFNLDATLHAAEAEGLINILSAPKVATLNNERASIQSGLQIPIQTVANNTVSVQFVNATLRLDVTPQVTAEGTVLMDINIQKREPQLAFAVGGATTPPISTQEARTRVIGRDGGTTVIGGIYEVSTDQGEDRVPGLASVPIIKHLFKNKRRSDENQELLIFITPRVMKL